MRLRKARLRGSAGSYTQEEWENGTIRRGDKMLRVSVTQMDDFQKCQQFWLYRHIKGLRPREKPAAMQSGSAFHDSIEQALMLPRSERIDTALAVAEEHLGEGHRLLPGVLRAIEGVPQWLWEVERPVAEDKLEVDYSVTFDVDCLTVVGKPDLWTVTDRGVEVTEFKSTGKKGSKFQEALKQYGTWATQAVRYCVLLYDSYPHLRDLPFYYKYLLQSTATGESDESECGPITITAMDRIRTEMLEICRQIAEVTPVRSYGILCNWCDFQQLCTSFRLGFEGDEGEFETRS
jgi:hypothetical protein